MARNTRAVRSSRDARLARRALKVLRKPGYIVTDVVEIAPLEGPPLSGGVCRAVLDGPFGLQRETVGHFHQGQDPGYRQA